MATESERNVNPEQHLHVPVTVEAVAQRNGVPYATTQVCCATCGAVLEDRRTRRAAA
jgi:hypothetical protein